MYELNYTKKEIKKLKKALNTILVDLEKLWNLGAARQIEVPVELDGIPESFKGYLRSGWSLVMNESGFAFVNPNQNEKILLFEKKKHGQMKKYLDIFPVDISFIQNYEKIRNDVVSEIEKAMTEKERCLKGADELLKKLVHEATIEIELPETNNQHRIEIIEESGQKIGTLNFGNLGLKIISTANIEFKTPSDSKVKRK